MSGRPRKTRYARLAGTAWRHRVTSALSVEAFSLWARCLSYCPDARSDGAIPAHMLRAVAGGRVTDRQVKAGLAECVAAGLIAVRSDGDYELVGYLDHNMSREGDDARLDRDRNRKGNEGHFRSEMDAVSGADSESFRNRTQTHDSRLMTQDTDPIGSLSSQTLPGVPGARGVPTTSEPTTDDSKARAALTAYLAAEQAAGSICEWTTGTAYGQLVTVHRLAETQAGRTGQSVADVLAAWARRYVAERQKRHPRWWLDCVNDWLAAPAKATVERRGSLPVATREDLLTDSIPEAMR